MSIIDDYIDILLPLGEDYIDENFDDFDSFDELWDELEMTCTGNDGSGIGCFDKTYIQRMIWTDEFIDHVGYDCGMDMSELLKKGADVAEVWARYYVYDYYLYGKLSNYYDDLMEEKEEARIAAIDEE